MKQTIYILTLALGFLSCNGKTEKTVDNSTVSKATDDKIKLHKLKKLFVVGEFEGNKKIDTIFQHNFSKLTRTEIENSADPYQNEWDIVMKWFYDQDADVYLTINNNKQDTLHLATAQGLYCLINIGDNNKDGKDEIAFVIDKCDYSRTNTCKIYTLCNGKWQLLKEFGIREDAFEWKKAEAHPNFNSIKGYLEKQNNVWKYIDINQNEYEYENEVGKMKVLELNKCK